MSARSSVHCAPIEFTSIVVYREGDVYTTCYQTKEEAIVSIRLLSVAAPAGVVNNFLARRLVASLPSTAGRMR